jgi:hypothetical protein
MTKRIRYLGDWQRRIYSEGEDREVNVPGTLFGANLAVEKINWGGYLHVVELLEFDETGKFKERPPIAGIETTVRKARLAAERALRRIITAKVELVR